MRGRGTADLSAKVEESRKALRVKNPSCYAG